MSAKQSPYHRRRDTRNHVKIIARLKTVFHTVVRLTKVNRELDEIKINQGRVLAELNAHKKSARLNDYEFKIFSQWGEDGIIQFLISNLAIKNKTFIEFGTEDFFEGNCRFLLMKDHWEGFVIDGSPRNIRRLQSSYFYWRYPLTSKAAFITRENINSILGLAGFDKELGILSVDIDGVDYYVLSEMENWKPSILIVEYNAVFGGERAVSVPYDAAFSRARKHYSHLYYGASLPAFVNLLSNRGHALVGVNSAGSNAFFVRRDLLNDRVKEVTVASCFRDSCFREGRDSNHDLTYSMGRAKRQTIANMPLVDVMSGKSLSVRDLGDS